MPIDTDSEKWESGVGVDRLSTNIAHRLLLNNPDKAYTVEEIADWVLEEYPELVPNHIHDSKERVTTLVAAVLDRLDRREFVTCRAIEIEGEDAELYYKNSEGDALYPNVRLNHEVPERFEDIEGEISELGERLSNLEYEVRVEDDGSW
ncbi:hypothetical protein ACERIM_09170 [Natrinema sp. H-ect1]|uniref:hypothetical protein n=1 Tax=Natrinema sp. H-ect1 TaxID=3242700 RepID=UPI00359D5334